MAAPGRPAGREHRAAHRRPTPRPSGNRGSGWEAAPRRAAGPRAAPRLRAGGGAPKGLSPGHLLVRRLSPRGLRRPAPGPGLSRPAKRRSVGQSGSSGSRLRAVSARGRETPRRGGWVRQPREVPLPAPGARGTRHGKGSAPSGAAAGQRRYRGSAARRGTAGGERAPWAVRGARRGRYSLGSRAVGSSSSPGPGASQEPRSTACT